MTSGQVKSVPNFWSANLAHRELRNATFEGKKSQPQLHFRTLYIVECTKHEARTIGKKIVGIISHSAFVSGQDDELDDA